MCREQRAEFLEAFDIAVAVNGPDPVQCSQSMEYGVTNVVWRVIEEVAEIENVRLLDWDEQCTFLRILSYRNVYTGCLIFLDEIHALAYGEGYQSTEKDFSPRKAR
jgi:hypothetical protein